MDDTLVRELLADHSRNPRNYGELPDPDVTWEASNPQCVGPTHPDGDQVTLQATLSDASPRVLETVRFTGRGCTLSQAAASLLTARMEGTDLDAVLAWDSETIEAVVGMELTPSRLHCAELSLVALRRAIENYEPADSA